MSGDCGNAAHEVGTPMPLMVGHTQAAGLAFWIGGLIFFGLLPASRRRRLRQVLAAVPVAAILACVGLAGFSGLREAVNWFCEPQRLFLLAGMALALALVHYRWWTRPRIAWPLMALGALLFLACTIDEHFRRIVSGPDNIPIVLLIAAVTFFLWVGLRRMAINDERIARGQPPAEDPGNETVMTWPDLLLIELILMLFATAGLIVWAILVRAPLEPPADPSTVPNPAKAPWYFLGLQELLVYFDPWLGGVFLPALAILGLCAIPYLDRNPARGGTYTLRDRPLAVTIFLAGFVLLWILPIVIGTFLRGPNWSFFGPFEPWDPLKSSLPASTNLSEWFWTRGLGRLAPALGARGLAAHGLVRESPGLVVLGLYFFGAPLVLKRTWLRRAYGRMGPARYVVFMFLLTWMALVPIKMLLRWLFDLKYVLALTEWSFNI